MGQSARKRWKSIPKLRRLAILAGKMSDGSLPPSPPAEKAASRQDQTGKASTGEGSGNWSGIGSDDAREVARGRIVVTNDAVTMSGDGITSKPQNVARFTLKL
jgi:hypothetical protein